MEEVTGDWRTLHSDELLNLCSSSNIRIKDDETGSHVAHMGETINAYKTLKEKPERKIRLEDLYVGKGKFPHILC
jgi:hypothetical protein